MKQVLKKSFLFFVLTGSFACNNRPATDNGTAVNSTQTTISQKTLSPAINDDTLNAIYPHYIKLTNALVDGKQGEAKLVAGAIERGAQEAKGGAVLQKYARQIQSASSLEGERAAYAGLSDEFFALVKKAGVKHGELYRAYCPMAMNNKGAAWLSWNKDEIRNPYFGKEMLSCGTIEETISEGTRKQGL